jgi:hypothetical protein
MAEQNRRTAQQTRARGLAQREVDRYIAYVLREDTIDQISRESRSIMGAWSDFEGRPPSGSGFSEICPLADKVDKIKRQKMPEEFALAYDRIQAMAEGSPLRVTAICVDRAYRNRTKVAIDPFTEQRLEIHWDDSACAELLRCSVKVFQRRVTKGYSQLECILGFRVSEAA